MKNIVIFDVRDNSSCVCVANIFVKNDNTINLAFEAAAYENPKIEVSVNDVSTFYNLTVSNGVATIVFPYYRIFTDDITTCKIRYVDGEKVGTWFTLFLSGAPTDPGYRTLKVLKDTNTTFTIKWVASELKQVSVANPSQFNVSDDGEISLKEVKVESVTAAKNDKDQVTLIGINYDDGTSSINQCVYNADGDLVQFGDIEINWGE